MKIRCMCLLAGMSVVVMGWTGSVAPAQQGDPPNGNASAVRFEVSSVRECTKTPAEGEFAGIRAMPGGQTYIARCVPLKLMMKLMYKITDGQIVGAPDWINNTRFDVSARAEHPDNLDNLHIMFQNMLADRFKLQFLRETRTLPAWVVTVDKNGTKMKVNPSAEPWDIPIKFSGGGPPPTPPTFTATHANMEYLCWWLGQQINGTQQIDRPVVDQTGLKGFY